MKSSLILALCATALACPTSSGHTAASAHGVDNIKGLKGFTVKQVLRKVGFAKTGSALTANVYRKFGKVIPTEVEEASAIQSGTVIAYPEDEFDNAYLSPVVIGGQILQLDIDTGSADLWVFSSRLSAANQGSHDVYDPSLSPTSKELKNHTWTISYGDGSGAGGVVYTDTVSVGPVEVEDQAVELATRISAAFTQDEQLDGILGLGFDHINTVRPNKQSTFFENVKDTLPEALFTVDLKYKAVGSYDFGFIDQGKYDGQITYVDVDSTDGYWQFTATGFAVGAGTVLLENIVAIADTGTTLVYLPSAVAREYYAAFNATYSRQYGGYVFPCSTKVPPFTLQIGSHKAVLPGLHLNYGPVEDGSSTCYGGIQTNAGLGFSILGDIFLKSQFTVFQNSESPQLGFARKPYDETNPQPELNGNATAASTATSSTRSATGSTRVPTSVTTIIVPTGSTRPSISATPSASGSASGYPTSRPYSYPTAYPVAYRAVDEGLE